jgi:hypothetical protein
MMKRTIPILNTLLAIMLVAIFLIHAPVQAADCTWVGGTGDWSDPANWSGCNGNVPGVDDTAVINSGNPVVDIITSVGSVTVGAASGGLTINDGATLTIVDTFSQNNEIGGEGDMVIEGHWYWLRGHHSGSGETTLSASGQMTITLNTSTQLNRTIINNGEALWNEQSITSFAGDGLFINNGAFTVVHDATFNFADFDNQGSFIKTGSSGVVSFNANRFTNDGSVSVEAGTLYLLGSGSVAPVDSGSYTADPGALLRFGNVNRTLTADSSVNANQVLVSSGSLNIHGDYDVATTSADGSGNINWHGPTAYSLPVVDHDGSSIGGDAPLLIEEEFIWKSGHINGSSPMTITADAFFDISLSTSVQLNRTVVNEGTAVWSSGNLTSLGSGLGTLINNNLFTTSHGANATASTFNLINNGRFIKTGDADLRFNSNPTAQNNGEIHVAAGSLTFAGGLDNYANNTLTGGAFVVTGTLRIQNADIQVNQADVALHTAGAAIQNTAVPPADGLANFAENGVDGRFALRYGAAITLPHALTNSGELIVGPQSIFTSDGYVQSSSDATTTIELAGLSTSGLYGQIQAGPQATLAGTFQVGYLDGFVPDSMDSYVVMHFANRTGTFANFAGLSINGAQVVTVAVNPNTVVINGIGLDPEPGFSLYLPLVLNP